MTDIFEDEPQEEQQSQVEEPQEEVQEEVREEPQINTDSTVPLAALNESRAQLRQTQSELSHLREQMAQFETLKQELSEFRSRQTQQSSEDEFNTDPLGTLRKQISGLEEKLSKDSTEQKQTQERAQQEQQLFASISNQVTEFKQRTPDYDQALNHVLETRKNELLALGATEYEAQQRVAIEAQEIAMAAVNSGRNAGEVVYELAKVRGYESQKTAERLKTIDKGQRASKSLSGSSGAPDSDVGLAEVDQMSDAEFDKWWSKNISQQHH